MRRAKSSCGSRVAEVAPVRDARPGGVGILEAPDILVRRGMPPLWGATDWWVLLQTGGGVTEWLPLAVAEACGRWESGDGGDSHIFAAAIPACKKTGAQQVT